ncbi:hypothetical protein ALC62_04167 [Cyphomyrmex costatus]|uniref:DUF4817 domain-containing protein n=1 Tax=Cyphomyrmex costatus TaxID=456900 RepID=A0A151IKE2_9HYME|nr:hypothetical protein ALC62_04167 [Cyphomyrmex costatus]
MRYTKAEKVDMIFVYGECRQIMREAVRLYTERFPDRVHPSFSVFSNIVQTFQETGSVDNKKCKRIKKATESDGNSTNILAAVALNPHISTRQLERESDISRRSVLRILHSNKFHPFHISLHQELHGNDFQNCIQFCEWALQRLQEVICLPLKSYLLTKLHLQTMDK